MKRNDHFLIVGAGVIGLSVGWQLLRHGKDVTILEKQFAGEGASSVAAGMLAPQTEVGYEELELLSFGLESLKLYPRFLEELEQDSGERVLLRKEGTLTVALDRDDLEALKVFYDFRKNLKLSIQWLTGEEARDKEPLLSPKVIGAVFIPDDLQINPRELLAALKKSFIAKGGTLREETAVSEILVVNEGVKGVCTENEIISAENVVLAAGCWSSQMIGIPEEFRPPVRPVKGQIIRLQTTPSCQLTYVVRAPEAYLVPKSGNRLVVGATSEEMGYDLSRTAGPIMELLEGAYEAVPSVYDCTIETIDVGLRPGSRDNLPLLGETPIRGLHYSTGHSRHGILLTPVTAYAMLELLLQGDSKLLSPFKPSRFFAQATAALAPK